MSYYLPTEDRKILRHDESGYKEEVKFSQPLLISHKTKHGYTIAKSTKLTTAVGDA